MQPNGWLVTLILLGLLIGIPLVWLGLFSLMFAIYAAGCYVSGWLIAAIYAWYIRLRHGYWPDKESRSDLLAHGEFLFPIISGSLVLTVSLILGAGWVLALALGGIVGAWIAGIGVALRENTHRYR